jgi:hypothetical protein
MVGEPTRNVTRSANGLDEHGHFLVHGVSDDRSPRLQCLRLVDAKHDRGQGLMVARGRGR